MKPKPHPNRAAELTPRGRSMRKKSLPQTAASRKSRQLAGSSVSIEVKSKRPPRINAKRQLAERRKSAVEANGFSGAYILGAVITLLALLLIGALIVIVLEKPQAAEAWKLVGAIFPPTIASLLAFLAGRSTSARHA